MADININDKRMEVYEKATPEIQNLYDSEETDIFLKNVYSKFEFKCEYFSFGVIVSDVILGLNKTADLPRLFQQNLDISADESQKITSELLEFLSPVIKREEGETNIKKEDIAKLAETFEAANEIRPKEVALEGKPTDVQPLRTMQGDMDRVHGYGAYRAANPDTEQHQTNDAPQQEKVVKSPSQETLLQKSSE